MSSKVLCVDDDANILAGFQRNLRKRFALDVALGGEEALATIERDGPYAVVVADMQMPGMNGIQFFIKLRRKWPDTVRIMLTGNADQHTAVEAVNAGNVYRFLNKPCSPEMLALALDAGLGQYRLITGERELLENTLNGSIRVLTDILAAVDPRSFGRGQVLRDHMRSFLVSLDVQHNWQFEVAAVLSQIGCVTIPPKTIQRARDGFPLSGSEEDMLRRLPAIGSELLARIPRLEEVSRIILYQHKNFDGSGFPLDSVAGDSIPLASRILKVLSDLFDYELQRKSRHEALLLMQTATGRYDPQVLDAAFKCYDVYLAESSSVAAKVKLLGITELRIGQVLLSDLETKDGMLILPAGNRLTPVAIEKIRNFARTSGIKEPIRVEE